MGVGMQIGAVGHQTGTGEAAGAPPPRLVHAAQQFEGQMMKELLAPMLHSGGLTGDGDDAGSNGALDEFAGEALGEGLSARGGLGIARRIVQDLSSFGTASSARATTGNGSGAGKMRALEGLK